MANRKQNNRLLIALIGLVVILVAALIWRNQNKPKGEKVAAEQANLRSIIEEVSASGKVFPQTEVKISSDVSGEIVALLVEEGDSVVAGQLLAKIDPDAFQSQVERGAAGVNSAKAQLANARSQIERFRGDKKNIEAQLINARNIYKRNKELHKEGVISDLEIEQSQTNLEALEANLVAADAMLKGAEQSAQASKFSVKSSEASLKELQTSLKRTAIYAPMSGIISLLNVEEGERVVGTIQMTGTEMMRIANLNAMEVRVEVSENDVPRVSIGDEVAIEVDAYVNRTFKGRVTQIANSSTNAAALTASLTSDQVTNFEVRINIEADSYKDLITAGNPYPFRPGMSASVDIKTEEVKDALAIAIQSVTTREKEDNKRRAKENEEDLDNRDLKEVVFVVLGDTVAMIEVKTGIQDDSYIQILEGLEEGDEVVTAPYAAIARKLEAGERVTVVEEEELYGKDDKK